ncbi:hypothetical protein AK830_g10982 [Neonectria ditissima]|uniref:Uncharacterized protein n=1 Tax=Neonectria ditissima TaxID=78410 RepID=A0A0P7B4V5_9HYPO|nr:hypothetical protein AK830_g10982 [Neonectria ditissima]
MAEVKIHTVINSRYQVFDRSGSLPFSIVFGLCRRSSEDTDPRPLRLNTAKSILDVPYALSHKLLILREHDTESKRETEVDVGQLGESDSEEQSELLLPSPVGRTENWKKSLSKYQYHINPSSKLASFFKPGKKYAISNKAGGDLGGKGSTYAEQADPKKEQGKPSTSSENLKLVSSRADGRASFTVVPSLPWPPKVQTRMQRCRSEGGDITDDDKGNATLLEITVLNTGNEAITVQTRGRQRFLVPRGPMEAEEDFPPEDPRPRIIDTKTPAPAASIQVVDTATGTTVRGTTKPGVCGLYQKHDPRPKLELLVTLKPGEPLIRHVDVSRLLADLPDGSYGLRMEPRGMWWCIGSCEDFKAEGEDRVPYHLYSAIIPPFMLECEDVVELQVENGVAS